jgi:hypothetical protein
VTKSELQAAISEHLNAHDGPGLTAYEIARGLGLDAQTGQTRVRNALRAMLPGGGVRCVQVPRGDGDHRPVFRWSAPR